MADRQYPLLRMALACNIPRFRKRGWHSIVIAAVLTPLFVWAAWVVDFAQSYGREFNSGAIQWQDGLAGWEQVSSVSGTRTFISEIHERANQPELTALGIPVVGAESIPEVALPYLEQLIDQMHDPTTPPEIEALLIEERGWPIPWLTGMLIYHSSKTADSQTKWAIPLDKGEALYTYGHGPITDWRYDWTSVRLIPLYPIWYALLGNIAIISVCTFGIWNTLKITVACQRLARAHCPLCRYQLIEELQAGCPECGWNRPTQ